MYDVNEPLRPRGAPDKGSYILFESPFENSQEGKVVAYLSSAFLIERADGIKVIIGVNESWKLLEQPSTE